MFAATLSAYPAVRLRAQCDLDAAARRFSEAVGSIGIIWRAQAEKLRGQIAEQRDDTTAAVRG